MPKRELLRRRERVLSNSDKIHNPLIDCDLGRRAMQIVNEEKLQKHCNGIQRRDQGLAGEQDCSLATQDLRRKLSRGHSTQNLQSQHHGLVLS